eukprot:gene11300-3043_t
MSEKQVWRTAFTYAEDARSGAAHAAGAGRMPARVRKGGGAFSQDFVRKFRLPARTEAGLKALDSAQSRGGRAAALPFLSCDHAGD